MKKRIFSLVLALMLCLSLAPMAALAASDEPTGEIVEPTGEIAEETVAEPTGEIAEATNEIAEETVVEPTPEPEEAMPLALEGDGESTAIAEVTTDSGSSYISGAGDLLDALVDYSTTRVKLLRDVTATPSSALSVKSSELTLDLNGHKLEIDNSAEIYIGNEHYSYDTIHATLTITDSSTLGNGSLLAKSDIKVHSGSTLNINRGSLSVVKRSEGSIVVNGAMKVSGSASVNSIFISEAEASLTVTGGEINDVYISGGKVSLSGGTFGSVSVVKDIDFTDCLADGYAFYGKPASGGETAEYTVLAKPTKDDYSQYVLYVQVKEHSCSLEPQTDGTYSCTGCGRTGLKDAVEYLDENGDEKECRKYTVVENTTTTWSDGWYVVKGDMTIDGAVEIRGDVHLILCDGARLTVEGSVSGIWGSGSLAVYGQSGGTGALKAKSGDVSEGDDDAEWCGIEVDTLTVNGGSVTATAGNASTTESDSAYSRGIEVDTITVNGGSVTGIGGVATVGGSGCSYSDGIYVDGDFTVNGGNVTGIAAVATVGGFGYSYSDGICVYGDFTVSDGTVTATTAGTSGEDYDICVYYDFALDGGTVKSGREGGAVRVFAAPLEVSGGTMKLAEGSSLYGVKVSEGVKLADLPVDGCAYHWFEDNYPDDDKDLGFVTLGDQTELLGGVNEYRVEVCTHSTTEGVCAYCGKDFTPEPTETPSTVPAATPAPTATPTPTAKPQAPNTGDEANVVLWLVLATASVFGVAVVGRKKVR